MKIPCLGCGKEMDYLPEANAPTMLCPDCAYRRHKQTRGELLDWQLEAMNYLAFLLYSAVIVYKDPEKRAVLKVPDGVTKRISELFDLAAGSPEPVDGWSSSL